MSFLVFWYGNDLSSAYSFLSAKNFKEYDVKLDRFSPKLQKKIDSGKGRLTKEEEYVVRSFEEMRQDLAKTPEDRKKAEFKELHEMDKCAMLLGSETLDVELISNRSDDEEVLELLQSKRDIWVQEIRNFNRDPSHNVAKNEAEESTEPQDMEESRVAPKHSNKRNADDKSSQEKPKAKKPKRDSSAKKKSSQGRVAASPEELEKAQEVARRDFETEKARILGEVPEEHKSKWGQVGFGKWGQSWFPCLILGPYDVSPTSAMREGWLKMFENVRAQFLTWYRFLVRIFRCEPKCSQFRFSFLFRRKRGETQCHS
jgi:hypothetical protein